jgi:hypothetical protein
MKKRQTTERYASAEARFRISDVHFRASHWWRKRSLWAVRCDDVCWSLCNSRQKKPT